MGTDMDGEGMSKATSCSPPLHVSNCPAGPGAASHQQHHDPLPESASTQNMQGGSHGGALDASNGVGAKALPFEFRALEVCLDSACRCLESEVRALVSLCYLISSVHLIISVDLITKA